MPTLALRSVDLFVPSCPLPLRRLAGQSSLAGLSVVRGSIMLPYLQNWAQTVERHYTSQEMSGHRLRLSEVSIL